MYRVTAWLQRAVMAGEKEKALAVAKLRADERRNGRM
jgi:hypothetical protein